jgi:hypothetical protein
MTIVNKRRPFVLRPIIREPAGINSTNLRATHRTAATNYWYIVRQNGRDEFGPTPDFEAKRGDLIDTGREAPIRGPRSALAGVGLWQAADEGARAHLPAEATAFHAVGDLPVDGTPDSWRVTIQKFCADQLNSNGMIVDWGIHAFPGEDRLWKTLPHVHLLITARTWRHDRSPGRRHPRWIPGEPAQRGIADAWLALTGLPPRNIYESAG